MGVNTAVQLGGMAPSPATLGHPSSPSTTLSVGGCSGIRLSSTPMHIVSCTWRIIAKSSVRTNQTLRCMRIIRLLGTVFVENSCAMPSASPASRFDRFRLTTRNCVKLGTSLRGTNIPHTEHSGGRYGPDNYHYAHSGNTSDLEYNWFRGRTIPG